MKTADDVRALLHAVADKGREKTLRRAGVTVPLEEAAGLCYRGQDVGHSRRGSIVRFDGVPGLWEVLGLSTNFTAGTATLSLCEFEPEEEG